MKKPSLDELLRKLQTSNAVVDATKVKGGTTRGYSDCHPVGSAIA